MTPITWEEIDAAKSPKGGFTRKTLEQWGVPWPPPSGWRDTLAAYGFPYQHDKNEFGKVKEPSPTPEGLRRMMEASAPDINEQGFDVDPARLLQKVVVAVIGAGRQDILWEFPEVLDFFEARIPERHEVSHLHNIDERMFAAAERRDRS